MTDDFEQQTFVMGMVLGLGVATSVGLLATGDVLPGVIYGPSGGIVVGATLARVTPELVGRERPRLAFVVAAAAIALAVGAAIGALVAWTRDASLLTGLLVGAAGGTAHGLLLAGSRLPGLGEAPAERRQTGSVDATRGSGADATAGSGADAETEPGADAETESGADRTTELGDRNGRSPEE